MVICLERRADLHMSQLMPLPLADSCFSKIQIGFTFLVSAHLGSPGQSAVKRMCVCVCVFLSDCRRHLGFSKIRNFIGRSALVIRCINCLFWISNFTRYWSNVVSVIPSHVHSEFSWESVVIFFWKSVYICIGYCQKSNGLFFLLEHSDTVEYNWSKRKF